MQLQKNNKIRWAIIGLGNIANKFAQDLLTIDDAQLYAVASRTQQKADQFANKYQAVKAYDSYQAVVDDPNVDAVYIATPHTFHKEHALLCLQRGIAVLCEKPFAMDSAEVEHMINTAETNNTLLMEALWTYFLPHYQFVLDTLNNNTYGKLTGLQADFGFIKEFDQQSRLFNKELGGGSLLDIGIYPIFAALTTLGLPNNISANATFFENGADSSCNMQFNYGDKVIAKLQSTLIESTPVEAVFYCEHATIKINSGFHSPTTVTLIKDEQQKVIDFDYKTNGYSYEIIHFNQLLREHKSESPIMTFNFSRELMGTLDRVRKLIALEYN